MVSDISIPASTVKIIRRKNHEQYIYGKPGYH
jgi:hypothetical protein